jgi:hypothetical protein
VILQSFIALGNDKPCNSRGCSGSFNAVWYSYNTATELHMVQVDVGCKGHKIASSKVPGEVVNLLTEYRDYPGGAEVKELIRWLVK